MKIISKQHDIYDYLQDPTDTLVFDRRESFMLTKELMCDSLYHIRFHEDSKYRFVLLQCGVTYWLFLITITEYGNYHKPANYIAEILGSWKDYNKPREIIKVSHIYFYGLLNIYDYKLNDYSYNGIKSNVNVIINKIKTNDYKTENVISKYTKYIDNKNGYVKQTLTIPLLKASGLTGVMNIDELFYAIEEYFSLEKSAVERTSAIGTTNDDKIIMHGFDLKSSFRGKR